MYDDELYHYGVLGMKWGQRRAAKQISKLTGKDRNKVSAKEADEFRSNVTTLKNIKNKNDREAYARLNAKKLGGKKYADAVLRQANKESARKFIGRTAGVTAGVAGATVAAVGAAKLYKEVAPFMIIPMALFQSLTDR